MPKLTCREGKSRKSWHGWVVGTELNLRYGPLGGTQQHKTKAFPSREDAEKELAKLIKQKLAKGYTDETRVVTFAESPLELRELVDPPLPVLDDASLAWEQAGIEGGWTETFWRGDFAFGGTERDETSHAGVFDRLGKQPRFRAFEPAIVGASYCAGFDHTSSHAAVSSEHGPIYLVETASFATREIVPAGAPIISIMPLVDRIAVLRKPKALQLEIYKPKGKQWAIEHSIPCGRQTELFAFGRGGVLMIGWTQQSDSWDDKAKAWPDTHFVAVDERGVRLLGTCGMPMNYALEKDEHNCFVSSTFGMLELREIDAALGKGKLVKRLS